MKDNLYSKNMFKLFDLNEDGAINFWEFIIGFATFSNDTPDKQVKTAFRLLDPEGKGFCTKEYFKDLMIDAT